jgi:high-affinity iron transporter
VGESFLIMLREGFEATLVVGILYAYLRRIDRTDLARPMWLGIAAGVGLATGVGLAIHFTTGSLSGDARLVTFALIAIAAACVLTWMIFWMARQSRAMKGDLEHRIDHAIAGIDSVARGVALVAFAAVLREGIEAALFLVALSIGSDGWQVLIGSALGIGLAIVLGWGVYVGGRTFPMRTFFRVTGVILIVFAAGLCAKAVFWFQAAGVIGSADNAVYNVLSVHWLTQDSQVGKFLAGLFGWDPRPSIEQVIAWVGYFVPVTILFLWGDKMPWRNRRNRRTRSDDEQQAPAEVPQHAPA